MYFATRRAPLDERQRQILDQGRAIALPWQTPARAPYAARGVLRGWRWGSGPPVLLIHGWHGRAAHLACPYVDALVGAGFSVVAFDMPGHGASPGAHGDFWSWAQAASQIVDVIGAPVAIIAHSFGAAVAGQVLREHGSQRLVAIAPFVWMKRAPERFCDTLQLQGSLRDEFWKLLLATHPEREWATLSLLDRLPEPVPAALFVQDEDDVEVPWQGAQAAAQRWGGRLELTRGLGHRRIVQDARVVALVVEFIAKLTATAVGGSGSDNRSSEQVVV